MSIEYFLDKCLLWEAFDVMDNLPWCDRNIWESQRLLGYLIAKANFKDIKGFKDICKFPWDDGMTGNTEVTDEDIKVATEHALKIFGESWQKH